jgi:hypothetical protein
VPFLFSMHGIKSLQLQLHFWDRNLFSLDGRS